MGTAGEELIQAFEDSVEAQDMKGAIESFQEFCQKAPNELSAFYPVVKRAVKEANKRGRWKEEIFFVKACLLISKKEEDSFLVAMDLFDATIKYGDIRWIRLCYYFMVFVFTLFWQPFCLQPILQVYHSPYI